MARLVTPLVGFRSALNARFPNRSKASDGWIGDTAHQREVSGHNPDDTVGVKAERSDSDSVAEVRAFDADKDFNDSVSNANDLVHALLASRSARNILIYIIWNGTIWSKSNGWNPRRYSGANPHTEHIHLSSDPAYDTYAYPWPEISGLGKRVFMAFNDSDLKNLKRVAQIIRGADGNNLFDPAEDTWLNESPSLKTLGEAVAAIDEKVNTIVQWVEQQQNN